MKIAVIHGGPGAPGEMAQVARKLSSCCGVIEPMQTKTSIRGQIDELVSVLKSEGDIPVILIEYSSLPLDRNRSKRYVFFCTNG